MSVEIGDVYGKLTVIDSAHTTKVNGKLRHYWACMCDCGNRVIVRNDSLISGHTTSCGCVNRQSIIDARKSHGYRNTKLYHKWYDMHQKCENPKSGSYNSTGKIGIRVCEEWTNPEGVKGYEIEKIGNPGFINFYNWAMKNYPDTAETQPLIRIDKTKDYTPDNCKFAKEKVNYRKVEKQYIFDGEEKLTYRQFDIKYHYSLGTTSAHVRQGLSHDEIVYAAKNPELKMRLYPKWYGWNEFSNFLDKDGFMHMIPRVTKQE